MKWVQECISNYPFATSCLTADMSIYRNNNLFSFYKISRDDLLNEQNFEKPF